MKDPTMVITGKDTRFSYCNLAEPKSSFGDAPRYSISLVISKDDRQTVKALEDGQRAAYEKYRERLKDRDGMVPPMDSESLKLAIRDGDKDRPGNPVYQNSFFVNASAEKMPKLFAADGSEVTDRSEVYSGCYGKAAVRFFAFNTPKHRGIGCQLLAAQKIRDGEMLGGATVTIADFMDADDEAIL